MAQQVSKYEKMTTGSVRSLICELAVPSIFIMLVTSIYNVVDSYFVGQIDTQSSAAVGVVFSYMSIIQAISFYFGHGSGNFISRALGAKKEGEAETMASTAFFIALSMGAAIALVCGIFMTPVLRLFGSTPTVLPYAQGYFKYILMGTPFIVGTFVLNNQMRFEGNANMALLGTISGAVLNMALDPLLIFGCGMGVAGAGLATAISQATGFLILLSVCGKRGGIAMSFKHFKPSSKVMIEINAGGLPSLFRQGLMALSLVFLNNFAGSYGDAALAAFAIEGRLVHLTASIVIGFGQGFQPVCGFNYGARLFDRVRTGFWFCTRVLTVYCIFVSIAFIFFGGGLIGIFRDDPEVIRIGSRVLLLQSITFPLIGYIIMSNMYLQTTRQTRSAVILAMAKNGLFFIPALFVAAWVWKLDGITAAQPVADFLTFLLTIPLAGKALKNMK